MEENETKSTHAHKNAEITEFVLCRSATPGHGVCLRVCSVQPMTLPQRTLIFPSLVGINCRQILGSRQNPVSTSPSQCRELVEFLCVLLVYGHLSCCIWKAVPSGSISWEPISFNHLWLLDSRNIKLDGQGGGEILGGVGGGRKHDQNSLYGKTD